jgi:hypothetical protein
MIGAQAQKNLVPASQSKLTGIALPTSTREDKRMLMRAAAKTTLDMEAKDSGLQLGDAYEVYLFPAMAQPVLADSLAAAFTAGGWRLPSNLKNGKWWLVRKDRQEVMVYMEAGKKESSLYLAEVKGNAPATAAATAANVTPPSANTMPSSGNRANENPHAAPATPPPAAPAGAGGYAFITTNFDDGWTAVERAEYVEVTKGDLRCYLHYRTVMTDAMRPPQTNVRNYFWARDVLPRFNIITEDHRRQELMYGPVEYIEGEATDRHTGKQVFVGMLVDMNSGGALNIVVVAPDKAGFYRLFPKPEDLSRMMHYNRFAVAPADLTGHWVESSGSAVQMYYVNSGNYAGMNAVSTSAEFWLQPDGTYISQHKGASGMVGNQSFFQQEYKGRYNMNGNWELSMTNRYQGKTDTFLCHFEVVRGGRILHFSDKSAPGIQYHLARVNP